MRLHFICIFSLSLFSFISAVSVYERKSNEKEKGKYDDVKILSKLSTGEGLHYDLKGANRTTNHETRTEHGSANKHQKLVNIEKIDHDKYESFYKKHKKHDKGKKHNEIKNNETVEVDGIKHFKNKKRKQADEIENEFRRLLQMKGVSYIYQRDAHWRTWRKIEDPKGNKIVCYRCESVYNENCTSCGQSGFWVIEEGLPPCSYEIFSVINEDEMCSINYKQLNSDFGACPFKINIFDLTAVCDNPIVTKWRFTDFQFSERNSSVICGTRENCEILTLYEIQPQHISFRIISNTDDVIYSRIMKSGNENFACVENCGRLDRSIMKVRLQRKLKRRKTKTKTQ